MKKNVISFLIAAVLFVTSMPGALAGNENSTAFSCPFSDVFMGDYYYDAVLWAINHAPQVTSGTTATTFSPYNTVTRGQAVTFLWRVMGEPTPRTSVCPFADVKENDYFCNAVLWASESGITSGTSSTSFSPDDTVTKGQMITFLYRAVGEPNKTGSGAWYSDAESWAQKNGLLTGTVAAYSTNASCLRGDVIYYLWKEQGQSASNSDVLKIDGAADETGIYSVVIRLTDKAADKGTVELVYYGAKGSPQENSIVNTFRIEYYKEASGTYEISTFYDGEVYQNQHHKDNVKVTNTFGAAVRARNVTVSYTPDGGSTQQVFYADAEYFLQN